MVQLPVDNHGRHQAQGRGRCAAGRQPAGVLAHAVRAIDEDGLHFHDRGMIVTVSLDLPKRRSARILTSPRVTVRPPQLTIPSGTQHAHGFRQPVRRTPMNASAPTAPTSAP